MFPTTSSVYEGDNLHLLKKLPSESFQVIYIDPPFNTGKPQRHQSTRARKKNEEVADEELTHRTNNKGVSYDVVKGKVLSYDDTFTDFWGFLEPRLQEAYRLLTPTGTLYLHLDWREVHYAKVMLDGVFGRDNFLNEIIWAYDYGAKSKSKWPTKHDNILVYVKDKDSYYFNNAEVDREPYMAPGLVTPEKQALGKLPTDVWWHTIVSPTAKDKTGYPTQKPVGILKRMIAASSKPGDWVLDFFGGSGSTGAAALELSRNFVLMDQNPQAIAVMKDRFKGKPVTFL